MKGAIGGMGDIQLKRCGDLTLEELRVEYIVAMPENATLTKRALQHMDAARC